MKEMKSLLLAENYLCISDTRGFTAAEASVLLWVIAWRRRVPVLGCCHSGIAPWYSIQVG